MSKASAESTWSPLQGLPRRISRRARWLRVLALGLLVGLVVGALAARHSFDSAEGAAQAYRISERAQIGAFRAPVGPIVVVAIDDYTCGADWHGCPVPRADTAALIDKLHAAGVRLIGMDQLFETERDGTDALASAIKRTGNVVIAQAIAVSSQSLASVTQLMPPIDPIGAAALDTGLGNVSCTTSVTSVRTYPLGCQLGDAWYPSFALALLRHLDPWAVGGWGHGSLQLNYAGLPGQTYPQYSYRTLYATPQCFAGNRRIHCAGVQGPDLWDKLRGKIVLVGLTATSTTSAGDLFDSPFGGARTPGVEIQATALNTLLNHDPLLSLSSPLAFLLSPAVALGMAVLATSAGLAIGLALGLGALALYYVLTFIALAVSNVLLPVVAPEIAMVASFLLVLGARYALEEREARRVRALFSRFVPAAVADDLVADAQVYGAGERRPIAVVFTDIRGFTSLSEVREPETIMGALRTYFTRMVRLVHEHGGTVDKYIGDGLMVLFGAPLPMADPCGAALRTALAMLEAMPAINAQLQEPLGTALRIGIGIHYGDAVVGLAGAPSKLEFTALGDTVNTASRLESLCRDRGCSIVLSEAVYVHLSTDLQATVRDLGLVSVKGRQSSIHVYGLDPPSC